MGFPVTKREGVSMAESEWRAQVGDPDVGTALATPTQPKVGVGCF
jgi:hypothetical protein